MTSLLHLNEQATQRRLQLLVGQNIHSCRHPNQIPTRPQRVLARTHNVAELSAETVALHRAPRLTPNGVCHVGLAY